MQELVNELSHPQAKPSRVVSLRRATAGDLVLSGVVLEDCAFAGAHGLDKLRIDATCSFQRPPTWLRDTWRPFTGRHVISEEAQWRQAHTPGWMPLSTTPIATPASDGPVPTALEIAGIYRDLRKGWRTPRTRPGRRTSTTARWSCAAWPPGAATTRTRTAAEPRAAAVVDRAQAAGRLLGRLGVRPAGLARADRANHPAGRMRRPVRPAGVRTPAGRPQHVSSVDVRTGALRYAPGGPPPSGHHCRTRSQGATARPQATR